MNTGAALAQLVFESGCLVRRRRYDMSRGFAPSVQGHEADAMCTGNVARQFPLGRQIGCLRELGCNFRLECLFFCIAFLADIGRRSHKAGAGHAGRRRPLTLLVDINTRCLRGNPPVTAALRERG